MESSAAGELMLVERDGPMALLRGALDAAARGEGSVVVVSGPAGIGKTSLLTAARGHAVQRGMTVLHARASKLEQSFTFGVMRALVKAPLRRATAAQRERLLAGAAAPAGLRSASRTRPASRSTRVAGLAWRDLLGDRRSLRRRAARAGRRRSPVGRRAVASGRGVLANRIDAVALALVVGTRDREPSEDDEALAAVCARAAIVTPEPLSVDAVARLVELRTGTAIDHGAAVAMHAATAGNPLLTEQAAAVLAAAGPPEGPGSEAPWSMQALPAVVLARLSLVSVPARALARAAAVLGDASATRHLAELSGLSVDAVHAAADELVAAGLFDARAAMSFAHAAMSEAVLSDHGEDALSHAHRSAARTLRAAQAPIERIAGHVMRTRPEGDHDSVADLQEAAVDVMRRGSAATALEYLQRAAAEPPRPAAAPGCRCCAASRSSTSPASPTPPATSPAPPARVDADVQLVVAHQAALGYSGQGDGELVRMLIAASGRRSDPDDRLLLTGCASVASWYQATRWLPPVALPDADTLSGVTVGERVALAAHALHLSDSGELGRAADAAERALGAGRTIAEQSPLGIVLLGALSVLVWAGRIDAFDREAEHVGALARATASSELTHLLDGLRVLRHCATRLPWRPTRRRCGPPPTYRVPGTVLRTT